MEDVVLRPIGIVHSPFREQEGTPIQPSASMATGTVEVFAEYACGLKDLDGFSHIILLYHFHKSGVTKLEVVPFMDRVSRGVFSTRAPCRPNPIGLSILRLARLDGNVLHVENLDILDGTPVLDIKPYVPEFDSRSPERIGWLDGNVGRVSDTRDDGRFG
jgi:tRNA-Thr(GGU) m(6)t(6)A37 methyltransferase TsaA